MKRFVNGLGRWNVLHVGVRLMLAVSMLAGLGATGIGHAAAAAQPTFRLVAPKAVAVDQPIEITLWATGIKNVAGYETNVLYDPKAASFDGLSQTEGDLSALGRDITPIGPAELSNGVSFGMYSCVVQDCRTRNGKRQPKGGEGNVALGLLSITPRQAGTLVLRVTGTTVVDANGTKIAVAGGEQKIVVQVGKSTTRFAAPTLAAATGTASKATTLDLNRDGLVSFSDLADATLAWTLSRRAGTRCAPATAAQGDVNGDGCVDVADLQRIAANYSLATTRQRVNPADTQRGISPDAARTADTGLTFVVNSTADTADYNIGDGVCRITRTSTACTLRAAIAEANAHQGPDTITFDISGAGVKQIQLASQLPALNDMTGGTTIDGYTQSGATPNTDAFRSNAALRIQLRGDGPRKFNIMPISSPNNVVRGLSFFNMMAGVYLTGPGATDNIIAGNWIGLDAAGGSAPTYRDDYTIGNVSLDSGASRNLIGGTALVDRNVIAGSYTDGISFKYEGTERNMVYNNIVGLAPNGVDRRNIYVEGIDMDSHTAYNLIGGTAPGQRNVIAGADHPAVEISHFRMTIGNRVVGNFVNTDVTGEISTNVQRSEYGIIFEDGVGNNVAHDNVVGAASISGIDIVGRYTVGNRVYDNLVGISRNGVKLGDRPIGVRVWFATIDSQIGPGNVITNNTIGIQIANVPNTGHTITRNSIYGNTAAGIAFGESMAPTPTLNDLGDLDGGPNGKLNFPVIGSAQPGEVLGTACPGCTVEVFVSDRGAGQYGQGKTFVGTAVVASNGTFNVAATGLQPGQFVTATATNTTDGNTSEFALNAPVTASRTTTLVADTFTRTASSSWGSAETGAAYTMSGTASDFGVANGFATITTPAAGNRGANLMDTPALNTDFSVRLAADRAPVGGSLFVYVPVRRVLSATEYQGRLRIDPSGKMYLQAVAVLNGAVTNITNPVEAMGVPYVAGAVYRLRVQVTGTAPTTLAMKVWPEGSTEPATWQYSVTDTTADLQQAGVMGLRTYVSGSLSNGPVLFAFDDLAIVTVGEPTVAVVPTSDPTVIAVDGFDRTLEDNWGSARPGGGWVTDGEIPDFDINGGMGRMMVPAIGNKRGALLTWNDVQDVNVAVNVQTDKVPTGSGQYISVVARRLGFGNEYQMRVRITPDGKVRLQAVRVVDKVETAIGNEVAAAGVVYSPNTPIRVRMEVSGTNPTTIRMRAWMVGATEPTTWNNTATDTTPILQQAGALGLRSYLPGSATNAGVLFSYDDYRATTITQP